MKRLSILIAAVAAGVLFVVAMGGAPRYYKGGTQSGDSYLVVASDGPSHLAALGTDASKGRWVCDGTSAAGGDEVEFAAACLAARTAGAGTVRIVGHTLYVTKPTVYPGYGPTLTEINDNDASIMADPWVDADVASADGISAIIHGVAAGAWDTNATGGTFAAWAIGDVLQLQGGADADGGESIEDNVEDCIATVTDITDVGPLTAIEYTHGTLTLTKAGGFTGIVSGDSVFLVTGTNLNPGWYTVDSAAGVPNSVTLTVAPGADNQTDFVTENALRIPEPFVNHSADGVTDYTGVDVDKVISALVVPSNVKVVGDGIYGTQINLADDSNCTTMMIWNDDQNKKVYTGLQDLYLYGRYGSQGDDVTTTYDYRCHGLVINELSWDVHINNVAVMQMKGDGVVICQPWGLQWNGGWIEYCSGKGMYVGSGNSASIFGLKIVQGGTDAAINNFGLYLREQCKRLSWNGGILGADNNWAVYMKAATENKINGAYIEGTQATSPGGVFIDDDCDSTVISGCTVGVDGTNASAIGIHLNRSDKTSITGCVFHEDCPDAIMEDTGYGAGTFLPFGTNTAGNVGTNIRENIKSRRVLNNSGGTLTAYETMAYRAAASDDSAVEIDQCAAGGLPVGVITNSIADGEKGYLRTQGYVSTAKIDNDNAGDAGDHLTVSDTDAGCLGIAASGNVVYAILESTENGDGTATNAEITLLPQTFIEP